METNNNNNNNNDNDSHTDTTVISMDNQIGATRILYESIANKTFERLSELSECGIPLKLVNELLKNVKQGTDEYKYLISLKILSTMNSYDDEHMRNLHKYNFCRFKYYLNIFSDESEEISKINSVDYDSDEYLTYCKEQSKLYWSIEQTENLQYVILLLSAQLLSSPNNIISAQPYLNKEPITMFKFFNAMHEIIFIYFLLLDEIYGQMKIENKINFPKEISWCFDNPNNPIEKTINNFLEENSKVETNMTYGKTMTMTFEKYVEFVKQTYNFDYMVRKIKEIYRTDEIMTTLKFLNKNEKFKIDQNLTFAIIVANYVMSNRICDNLYYP
jgi:hypothetical protein